MTAMTAKAKDSKVQKIKAKKVNKKALVKEIAEELLGLMGTKARPNISEDKKNDAIVVDIETDDEAGLLIGNRGDTLNSLQAIAGQIFRQKFGEWQRIIVNVSDWRERQEQRLTELAVQTAQRAKDSGESQVLYNLTPAQRRIVHLTLAENKKIETESLGEGQERYLVIRPKKSKGK